MNYLTDHEIESLIEEIKSGNNDAWEKIYHNFENYIHKCCHDKLINIYMSDAERKDIEDDLYMAGWHGFVDSLKKYNPENGKLLTYATFYINGEISKELNVLLNPLGLTDRPKPKKKKESGETDSTAISRISIDDEAGISENVLSYALTRAKQSDEEDKEVSGDENLKLMSEIAELLKVEDDRKEQLEQLFSESGLSDLGGYSNERTTLQILEILKQTTDEKHTVSKNELKRLLRLYRIAKYKNSTSVPVDNTFNRIIAEILLELNPGEYTDENNSDYRIKYDGYTEDKLNKRIKYDKSSQKVESGSAPVLNGLHYVHPFEYEETDRLIQLISFSDMLSVDEKKKLIGKIWELTGKYYTTPYWDGENLKFNPRAVHSRLTGNKTSDRGKLAESLKTLQYAVNNLAQVRFKFNRYNADHELVPTSEYLHELSPYHLVVYHDNYYCIGLKKGDSRVWHYRIDLMTDVEIIRDEEGKIVPVELTDFEGLPILSAAWDPEKYMSEHLNMAYDNPRDIRIRIKDTDYTIIHDWFGDHYEKVDEVTHADDDGNEIHYDIVKVRTSPSMIVHWAMQYGGKVEIMDEEIRKRIIVESRKVVVSYETKV